MFNKIFAVMLISLFVFTTNATSATLPPFVQSVVTDYDLTAGPSYTNGFEDIASFSNFYIVPQNNQGTASHTLEATTVYEGNFSHKGYQYGANPLPAPGGNTNHRAYPTIQMMNDPFGVKNTAVVVDFYVNVDIDITNVANKDWVSLATFSSYSDIYWPHSYLVNIDKNYKMHFQHVPVHSENAPDIYHDSTISFPRNQWVRVTVYIDYTTNNVYNSPVIALWQDGVLVSASKFNPQIVGSAYLPEEIPPCAVGWDGIDHNWLNTQCNFTYPNNGGLAQMHFGLYTPPLQSTGAIYNDKLEIIEVIKNNK